MLLRGGLTHWVTMLGEVTPGSFWRDSLIFPFSLNCVQHKAGIMWSARKRKRRGSGLGRMGEEREREGWETRGRKQGREQDCAIEEAPEGLGEYGGGSL